MTLRSGMVLGALALGLTACPFYAPLPEGVPIGCKLNADCPGGYVCTQLEVCVDESEADGVAPTLLVNRLSPAFLGRDATLELVFEVNEPLATDPVVKLVETIGGSLARTFEIDEVETDRSIGRYALSYQTSGQEEEGSHAVIVDLTDAFGNRDPDIPAGTVVLDFAAPVPLEVEVQNRFLNDNATVSVSFLLSESVDVVPIVVGIGANDAEHAFTVTQEGPRYTATLTASESADEEGPYGIVLQSADGAGNLIPAELGEYVIDFTPPSLITQSSPTAAFTAAGGSASIELVFDEPLLNDGSLAVQNEASQSGLLVTPSEGVESAAQFVFNLNITASDEGAYPTTVSGGRDLAGNIIVPLTLDTALVIDTTAPAIAGLQLNDTTFSAVAGYNSVVVTFTADAAPSGVTAELVDADGAAQGTSTFPCFAQSDDAWRCVYTVTGGEAEGEANVRVNAFDAAGNGSQVAVTCALDFTPPALDTDSVTLTLAPPPGSLRADVDALSVGSTAQLFFAVDNEVAAGADVTVQPAAGVAVVDGGPPWALTFFMTLDVAAGAADGMHNVDVRLFDSVGNENIVSIGTLMIDTAAPASPSVGTPGLVVLDRFPWGAEETNNARLLALRGNAGATEPRTLLIWSADESILAELGRTESDAADGSVSGLEIPGVDLVDAYVTSVDSAGNRSPTVKVRDGRWVATLNNKVPGSSYPNPHFAVERALTSSASFIDSRGQPVAGGQEISGTRFGLPGDNITADSTGGLRAEVAVGSGVAATPPPRRYAAQGYDPIRARAVYYGGECATCFDTWEWDGLRWQEKVPLNSPGRVQGAGMAFDPDGEVLILFGGKKTPFEGAAGDSNETWSWDGEQWQRILTPAGGGTPGPRTYPKLVFYPGDVQTVDGTTVHGGIVMHGGINFAGGFIPYNDMWIYTGNRWTEVQHTNPVTSVGGALAYDAARQVLVLADVDQTVIGATPDDLPPFKTYEFDGSSWTLMDSTLDPAPGVTNYWPVASAAFHPALGEVLLYMTAPVSPFTLGPAFAFNDTLPCASTEPKLYRWQSAQWVELDIGATGVGSIPDGCSDIDLVYFDERKEMLGIGWLYETSTAELMGIDAIDATWVYAFNGDNASAMVPRMPAFAPPGRAKGAMVNAAFGWPGGAAYFSVLVGGVENGVDDGPGFVDWFHLSSGGWQPLIASMERSDFAVANNALVGNFQILGGVREDQAAPPHWNFNWFSGHGPLTLPNTPTETQGGAAIRMGDQTSDIVFFGGKLPGGEPIAETWVFSESGGTWTLATPATSPPARWNHAMSYDPQIDRVVLFGGDASGDEADIAALDDTWLWNGTDWEELSPAVSPAARASHTMDYFAGRQTTFLIGGRSEVGYANPTWEFDGATWSVVGVPAIAPNLYEHASVYEPENGRLAVFGGDNETGGARNVTYDLYNLGRPAHAFAFEVGASGVALDNATSAQLRIDISGDGYVNDAQTVGAQLSAWQRGAFVDVSSTSSAQHQRLEWTAAGDALAHNLIYGRASFRVVPLGDNGAQPSMLSTDYVEYALSYRLPPN